MDIRTAVDALMMIAADGHIAAETGMYLHRQRDCQICEALETARVFCETLPGTDFDTGEPVTVGTATGRISHTELRVFVSLENIGVVSCLPVNVRRNRGRNCD